MNDMSQVIIPKADQISADDLLAGPLTIRITSVSIKPGTEQPVAIAFDGDEGRPWKPCKSMSRVLVAAWGPDANAYTGRSVTLYRDPGVKWGGLEVGGIRVSHLSDIKSNMVLALTATKGSKKPFTVKPLKIEAPAPSADPADGPAERPPAMLKWVAATIKKFEAAQTSGLMFVIIDEIQKDRDILREDAPEQEARIAAAVKAANARLQPKPADDEPPADMEGGR